MFDSFVFLPLSTRAYFKGRAYIKIILKNHARSYFADRSYYRGNTVAAAKNPLGNKQEPKITIPPCNCRNSANCPLIGKYREKAVIYKASITSNGSSKHYIGCIETEFKTRYYNHTDSFRYREKRNATEPSKTFWNAKDSGHEPIIKWSIADRATAYQPGS